MMDIHQILKQLPHRYPFVLVDRITEIEKGIFDSSDLDNTDPFFYLGMNLPYTKWFMKVIKEWYFYVENDIEDCIKAYYDVSKRNS